MKKMSALLLFFTLMTFAVTADVPGKKRMNECKITLQGINNLKDYSFHYSFHYGDRTGSFNADTTFIIPSSGGAPDGIEIWGINNKTGKKTDTLAFNNYYAPDAVIIFNKIEHDSIYITKNELSNKNEIVDEGNTDLIANKQLVAEAKGIKKSHYTKIVLFSVAGLAALIGLVWLFIRRKRAKKETTA